MRKLFSMALLLCLTGGFALAQTPTIERILNESSETPPINDIRNLLDEGLDALDTYGRTPLLLASMNRYTELAIALIEAGAKLDIQDDFGRTALRYAISYGDGEPNTELAEALIRAGADVNLADNDGNTPLTKISYHSYPKLIQLLIDKGAKVDVINDYGETPLSIATDQGLEENVRILTQAGSGKTDPLESIARIVTPQLLEIFRSQPFTGEIRSLVELLEKGVNTRDEQGMTALLAISNRRKDAVIFTASESGAQTGNIWLGMVRELIAMKADVNLPDNNGVTPLIAAVDCGEKEIALALIAAKADLSKGDNDGSTPLLYAAQRKEPEMLNLLLRAGADIEAKDNYGRYALHLAVAKGNIAMSRCLLDSGANMNVKDDNGETPLMYAVASGPEITRLLLERGADVNAGDTGNGTALMIAASRDAVEIVKMLLKYDADVNVTDDHKRTALTYAKSEEVKKILKAAGAK